MSHEPIPHLLKLTEEVDALSDALAKLSDTGDLKRLILLMRHPGWTTPAELAYASAIVASLRAQVGVLAQLRAGLVQASEKVAVK